MRKFIISFSEYLTEQQSNGFMKWFGNSVVVDEEANPLVVYHGTNVDFDVFDKEKIGYNHSESNSVHGGGIFFTDKKNKAAKGGIIKEAYLKIENPLLRELDSAYQEIDYYHATDMFDMNHTTFFQTAKENGNDGIIFKTPRGSLYIAFEPDQIKIIK